jgi:hypothetical protein
MGVWAPSFWAVRTFGVALGMAICRKSCFFGAAQPSQGLRLVGRKGRMACFIGETLPFLELAV